MSVLPKLIYRFNTTPVKTPTSYFVDIKKLILKFIWRGKKPNKTLKKDRVGRQTLPKFKTY